MPIYYIPTNTRFVGVADFFSSDLVGGAELTLDAILNKCPERVFKIRSSQIFNSYRDLIQQSKEHGIYWIFGNFCALTQDILIEVATSGLKYSVIECDFKACIFRSSGLHKLNTGKECACHLEKPGKLIKGFYERAEHVFFMSQGQLNEYLRLFPEMNNWPKNKLIVQGSTFDDKTLDQLEGLYQERLKNGHNGKWLVLGGGSWIKNQQETEEYCKKNNLLYEVVGGGLKPEDFLISLSKFKGLVFFPRDKDTAPRITIEAKLLGLELDLNENVQHKDEDWFKNGDIKETMAYLRSRPSFFWNNIEGIV